MRCYYTLFAYKLHMVTMPTHCIPIITFDNAQDILDS